MDPIAYSSDASDRRRPPTAGGRTPPIPCFPATSSPRIFGVSRRDDPPGQRDPPGTSHVSRQRSRGTIVSPAKIVRHWSPIATFEEDIERQGVRLETRVLESAGPRQPRPRASVTGCSCHRMGWWTCCPSCASATTVSSCYNRRSFASTVDTVEARCKSAPPVLDFCGRRRASPGGCRGRRRTLPSSARWPGLGIKPGVLVDPDPRHGASAGRLGDQ